jgi:hypothetical protein
MASMPLGTIVTLSGGFSKKISSTLCFGASASLALGGNDTFGWGLWSDIGIVKELGNIGFLQKPRLGFVLSGIGKEYNYATPPDGIAPGTSPSSGFPPAFTPTLGFSADLLNQYTLRVRANADIRIPSFHDIEADIGVNFSYRNIVNLRIALSSTL